MTDKSIMSETTQAQEKLLEAWSNFEAEKALEFYEFARGLMRQQEATIERLTKDNKKLKKIDFRTSAHILDLNSRIKELEAKQSPVYFWSTNASSNRDDLMETDGDELLEELIDLGTYKILELQTYVTGVVAFFVLDHEDIIHEFETSVEANNFIESLDLITDEELNSNSEGELS